MEPMRKAALAISLNEPKEVKKQQIKACQSCKTSCLITAPDTHRPYNKAFLLCIECQRKAFERFKFMCLLSKERFVGKVDTWGASLAVNKTYCPDDVRKDLVAAYKAATQCDCTGIIKRQTLGMLAGLFQHQTNFDVLKLGTAEGSPYLPVSFTFEKISNVEDCAHIAYLSSLSQKPKGYSSYPQELFELYWYPDEGEWSTRFPMTKGFIYKPTPRSVCKHYNEFVKSWLGFAATPGMVRPGTGGVSGLSFGASDEF